MNIFIFLYLCIPLILPVISYKKETIKYEPHKSHNAILLYNTDNKKQVIVSSNNIKNDEANYKYALLSEWFLSFYSSLFINFAPKDFIDNKYGINSYEYINQNNVNFSTGFSVLELRMQDNYIVNLNNEQILNYAINSVKEIISKYHDFNNSQSFISLLSKLKKEFDWNEVLFGNELELVRDLIGINTKYNLLFYLIKYNKLYSNSILQILNQIEKSINIDLRNLISFLWISESTNYNIFVNNNVLGTKNSIQRLYPNILVKNENEPITLIDYRFIRNDLIRFTVDNKLMFLNTNKTFQPVSNDVLLNISPNIKSQDDWRKYVDEQSVSYRQTKELLGKLNNLIPNIFNFNLSNNYFDLINYPYLFNAKLSTNLKYSNIMIGILCFLNIGLQSWVYYGFNSMQVGKK